MSKQQEEQEEESGDDEWRDLPAPNIITHSKLRSNNSCHFSFQPSSPETYLLHPPDLSCAHKILARSSAYVTCPLQ